MTLTGLPNFSEQLVTIVHCKDKNYYAIARQLERLGATVEGSHPNKCLTSVDADIAFFDVDTCHASTFPWKPGHSAIPLIAILGSEAPGALEKALIHTPNAYVQKPIASTGLYNVLTIAAHDFEERRRNKREISELKERVRARPVVFRAITKLMNERNITDTEAFEALRSWAMHGRETIEALCCRIVAYDMSWQHAKRNSVRRDISCNGKTRAPRCFNHEERSG